MSDDESLAPKAADGGAWKRVFWVLFWVVVLLAVGIVVYWAIWADSSPQWTGFGAYDEEVDGPRAKTLWDWMGLLIVPLVLALGALLFNASQKETELKRAAEQKQLELKIAEEARETEREIARDRQQQATLEAYYDCMTDLLLNHRLRETTDEDEERSIVRARTLAVLRGLDSERKGQIVKFLHESRLIDRENTVVNLVGANLRGVDLRGADLAGANLSWADLRGFDNVKLEFSEAFCR